MRMKDYNNPKLAANTLVRIKPNKKNGYFDDPTLDHEALKAVTGKYGYVRRWWREEKSTNIVVIVNGREWTFAPNDLIVVEHY